VRILVTGGSGFIGSRLLGLLQQAGHGVVVYDKAARPEPGRGTVMADIRDTRKLAESVHGCEAVIHLAAEHRDDVRPLSLYEEVNAGGARNLVAAAHEAGCKKIIFTSSVAVYPLNVPAPREEDEPRPFNEYGESKLKAEQVLLGWARKTPDAALVIVRPCVVFGEGNRGNVYNLLNQIYRRRFIMVGAGTNRKSMAYVGNMSQFLVHCLGHRPGIHLYNYADKPDLSVSELVGIVNQGLNRSGAGLRLPYWAGLTAGCALDLLAKLSGQKFPISAIRIRKFCADTTVSTQRLEQTGFRRPYSLEDALRRTLVQEFGGARAAEPRTGRDDFADNESSC